MIVLVEKKGIDILNELRNTVHNDITDKISKEIFRLAQQQVDSRDSIGLHGWFFVFNSISRTDTISTVEQYLICDYIFAHY